VKLDALPYHSNVAAHLRTEEGALWAWFESDQFSMRYTENVKLDLLKSTYRLTRADQPRIYAQVDSAREKLGLELPATIYQQQGGSGEANAALIFFPDELAIMLMGIVSDLLDEAEMLALLGHEISHHRLYSLEGGQYFTAARFLEWCALQPGCEASYLETDRLYRLHTEIFADMGALHVSGDRDAVISCLIKVSTGLKKVTPSSYLEQADEILKQYKQGSEGLTHPEMFIRAKALDLLTSDPPKLDEVAALVRGPLDTKRLDLVGQFALSALTRKLVDEILAHPFMRGEYTANLAERYFPRCAWPDAVEAPTEQAALAGEIAGMAKSCHDFLAYVLLDFATVDPDSGDKALAMTLNLAERHGLLQIYEPIARKELKRKKDDLARLKRSGADLINGVKHA
jgi:hypothetical protein